MRKKITLFVVFTHLAILLCFSIGPSKKLQIKHPMKVHTVVAQVEKKQKPPVTTRPAPPAPPKPVPPPPPPKLPPPPAPPKPVPMPPAPKPAKPQIVKKTGKQEQPSQPKKEEPIISYELLKQMEESIAKIEGKSGTVSSNIASDFEDPQGYEEILVAHLRAHLRLPEFGEVKIKLTLNKDGDVAKLVVIKAESQKNKHHLETHLYAIQFPPLGVLGIKKAEQTFVLTFCNDI